MTRHLGLLLAALTTTILGTSTQAAPVTLFDANAGLPTAQGWSFVSVPAGIAPSVTEGVYTLDTHGGGSDAFRAGNLRTSPVALDHAAGYVLAFDLRVLAESHANANRAGFSILAVGDDPTRSIELAFWTDEVWVYEYDAGFKKGASHAVDTTVTRDYALRVDGGQFTLAIDGVTRLTGALQDYTPGINILDPVTYVYGTANTLFFGDDTSSARAAVEMRGMSIAPVPLPAAGWMLLSALGALACARHRSGCSA